LEKELMITAKKKKYVYICKANLIDLFENETWNDLEFYCYPFRFRFPKADKPQENEAKKGEASIDSG